VAVLEDMRPLGPRCVGEIWSRPRERANEAWHPAGALGAMDEEGFLTVLTPGSGSCAAGLPQV
jgi:hypothetical protein